MPETQLTDGDTPSKLHEFILLFSCSNGAAPMLNVRAETMFFRDGLVGFDIGADVVGLFPMASLIYVIRASALQA